MQGIPRVPSLLALVLVAGCSASNVSVEVRDQEVDAASAYKPTEGSARPSGDDGRTERRSRPPFITLGTYEWDYLGWLQELTALLADVRLPDSAETTVRLRFLPGKNTGPGIEVDCRTAAAECDALRARLAGLSGYPPLPAGFPHGELEVLLSRVP